MFFLVILCNCVLSGILLCKAHIIIKDDSGIGVCKTSDILVWHCACSFAIKMVSRLSKGGIKDFQEMFQILTNTVHSRYYTMLGSKGLYHDISEL